MGLFRRKKQKNNNASPEEVQYFFDEYFSEELRNRGRWYFENVIKENAARFEKDLDATVIEVNRQLRDQVTSKLDEAIESIDSELKSHVTKQLEERFVEYTESMKSAQEQTLASLRDSARSLQDQYSDLKNTLRKNVEDQKVTLTNVFEENKVRIATMQDAQNMALESLSHSVEALQKQHEKLKDTLEQHVTAQQEVFIDAFKNNMAQVVEHYILEALGGQYDLREQLPSIMQQLEDKKDAIVEDMKL